MKIDRRKANITSFKKGDPRISGINNPNWKGGLDFSMPEYWVWTEMKQRCLNPKSEDYKNYGGRGIRVNDRWLNSFQTFIEDLGRRPGTDYMIDRIDNDGDYEPSNCRWTTRYIQNNNKRSNRPITYRGKTYNVNQWAYLLGMNVSTLKSRLNRSKFSLDKAFNRPLGKKKLPY